jgi:hypothetical protein
MNRNEFHVMHSETIMYCQVIENDFKWIYSFLSQGQVLKNRERVDDNTFGQMVRELQGIENKNHTHFLNPSDYGYLKRMTERRNYWAHEAFVDFLYERPDPFACQKYEIVVSKLVTDHQRFHDIFQKMQAIKKRIRDQKHI